MGFRNNAFATVWEIEDKGTFVKVRLSTSSKNKDTDQYEQDFSGYCMFVYTAKAKAEKLREKDRIQLISVDVTTKYSKELQKEYINYKVFDFEMADSGSTPNRNTGRQQSAPPVSNDVEGDTDEDQMPF